MKNLRFLFSILFVFVLAIMAVMAFLASRSTSDNFVLTKEEHDALYKSEDNGWHDIEAAMQVIQVPTGAVNQEFNASSGKGEFSTEAIAFLDAQQDALTLVRSGLEKEYAIPPRYDVNAPGQPVGEKEIRALARALVWDGRRLASIGQSGDAARRYLDATYLGHWYGNGGVLVNALITVAVQRIGIEALQESLSHLDDTELEHTIFELKNLEAIATPYDRVMATEEAIMREHGSSNVIASFIHSFTNRPAFDKAEEGYDRGRALIIGTRLRAQVILHEKQTGASPATLEEVLASDPVPIDPTTGNPFELTSDGKITSPGERPGGKPLEF